MIGCRKGHNMRFWHVYGKPQARTKGRCRLCDAARRRQRYAAEVEARARGEA